MRPCDTSKYNCGEIVPSSCVPYTGTDLTVLRDPSDLPCNANINDVIAILDTTLKGVLTNIDLTGLNPRCLAFTPATVTVGGLFQVQTDEICALEAGLATVTDLINNLNIGNELITINLLCLAPSAAPCLVAPSTYTLLAVLNAMVFEICSLQTEISELSPVSPSSICTDGVTILGTGLFGNCLRVGTVPPSAVCTDGVTILGTGLAGNCLRIGTVPPASVPFADFYGLTAGTGNGGPTDYESTIAVKTAPGTGRVPFPRLGATNGGATSIDGSSFTLPNVGTYEIIFTVHTAEPGQLQAELNGVDIVESVTPNMNPTAGGHLFVGHIIVTTTLPNEILAIVNPTGNTPALTIVTADGSSTHANAQRLIIKQIA